MADSAYDQIMAELDHKDPECLKCGDLMTSKRQWKAAGLEEREELRAEGYVAGGTRGMCHRCTQADYAVAVRPPGSNAGRPSRDWRPLLEPRLAELDAGTITASDLARELGFNPKTIRRQLLRVREQVKNG